MADIGRPFKVWSSDRTTRKSIVVKSLKELLDKGKQKLKLDPNRAVYAVMERDGTEVDDEEYFEHLENNTVLLLLQEGEQWANEAFEEEMEGGDVADSAAGGEDVADSAVDPPADSAANPATSRELRRLASQLRHDIGRLVTFTEEEQRVVATANPDNLQEMLGMSFVETSRVQQACYRYLDELNEYREAKELMKQLRGSSSSQGPESMDSIDGQLNKNNKRPRSEDT